jgi:hypothetical protein
MHLLFVACLGEGNESAVKHACMYLQTVNCIPVPLSKRAASEQP